MPSKRLTEEQKQEIFHTVVATQDTQLMSIPDSYKHVAKQFDISEAQVRQIAEEGIENDWLEA